MTEMTKTDINLITSLRGALRRKATQADEATSNQKHVEQENLVVRPRQIEAASD